MNTRRLLRRTIATAAVSVAAAVAGLVATGTAHAYPPGCSSYASWCPGQTVAGSGSRGLGQLRLPQLALCLAR